jgi:polysaccharide biosynthesis transport protein
MDKESQIQLIGGASPRLRAVELSRVEEPDSAARLRASWRIVRKRRWSIVSALMTVFIIVVVWTLKQKPVYEAKGLLEIEQESPNIVSVQELFQIESVTDDYVETQYKILQSDTLARAVIRQLHLGQLKEFNSTEGIADLAAVFGKAGEREERFPSAAAREQHVLQSFEDRLTVAPVQRSRLVRVTFDSQDPELAAKVVNALAESYIEGNLQMHWDAAQKASAWLSEQLDGLKIKLEKSEDELQQYATTNGLLYLESDKGDNENIVDERLRQLQDELTQAQADRYQKESLFRLAEAGDYGALPGVFDNKVTQDLMDRLGDLERQQAALAPDFKPDYPKMKQVQSQIDRTEQFLQQQRQEAERHVADEYFAAVHREDLVRQAFSEQEKEEGVVAQKSVQYNILKREVDTNQQLYEGLLQRLKEAGVSAGLRASNIRVVDAAVPPASPTRPRVVLNVAFGLLLGLVSGAGLAFVQERIDNTLKSPDDVEHFLRISVLGMIPFECVGGQRKDRRSRLAASTPKTVTSGLLAARRRDGRWARVDTRLTEQSELREAFRALRTSVLLASAGRPPRSLAFISAEAGEGKTTVCCNLAISLANLGKRVLVIDADIRRPGIQGFFDVSGSAGLVNYLAGEGEWRSFVQMSSVKGLDCLICGPDPPNPSELLSSERMEALIKDAMNDYNFVLVDSPPLLNVTDGRIVATVVEGAVLVVKGGATSREHVQRAQGCVADLGARVIGVVLNGIDLRQAGYYYALHDGARRRGSDNRQRVSA